MKKGFTLIELLVTIAVIGVLMALILGVVARNKTNSGVVITIIEKSEKAADGVIMIIYSSEGVKRGFAELGYKDGGSARAQMIDAMKVGGAYRVRLRTHFGGNQYITKLIEVVRKPQRILKSSGMTLDDFNKNNLEENE